MAEPRVPSVTLGRTGLVTSKLSLGTYGWGGAGPPQVRVEGDARILSLLRAAFAAGIRFLNTAEAYQNEAILGRLLPEAGAPPDLLIATTFGHGKGFSADQFRASAERSLRELRLERLPLMFVHDPRTEDDMRVVMGRGGALEGLRKLQSEGLVQFTGVATGTLTPLRIAVESDEFDVIQFPRLYTLLNQTARTSGLLEAARAKNIGTLSASPFGGHILATGAIDGALYTFAPALPEVRRRGAPNRPALRGARRAHCRGRAGVQLHRAARGRHRRRAWSPQMRSSRTCRPLPQTSTARSSIRSPTRAAWTSAFIGGPDFLKPWPSDPAV